MPLSFSRAVVLFLRAVKGSCHVCTTVVHVFLYLLSPFSTGTIIGRSLWHCNSLALDFYYGLCCCICCRDYCLPGKLVLLGQCLRFLHRCCPSALLPSFRPSSQPAELLSNFPSHGSMGMRDTERQASPNRHAERHGTLTSHSNSVSLRWVSYGVVLSAEKIHSLCLELQLNMLKPQMLWPVTCEKSSNGEPGVACVVGASASTEAPVLLRALAPPFCKDRCSSALPQTSTASCSERRRWDTSGPKALALTGNLRRHTPGMPRLLRCGLCLRGRLLLLLLDLRLLLLKASHSLRRNSMGCHGLLIL